MTAKFHFAKTLATHIQTALAIHTAPLSCTLSQAFLRFCWWITEKVLSTLYWNDKSFWISPSRRRFFDASFCFALLTTFRFYNSPKHFIIQSDTSLIILHRIFLNFMSWWVCVCVLWHLFAIVNVFIWVGIFEQQQKMVHIKPPSMNHTNIADTKQMKIINS